uniref:Uncharacterized protein n=1 Tax=Glossina pallidipes TaxID=7398 RepID=A0A1A9ZHD1_GLOPL
MSNSPPGSNIHSLDATIHYVRLEVYVCYRGGELLLKFLKQELFKVIKRENNNKAVALILNAILE